MSDQHDDAPGPTIDPLADNTIILRRLLAPRQNQPEVTKDRRGIGLTATSHALKPRRGEPYPSWSVQTSEGSARKLVELVTGKCDIRGACVCAVSVREVRAFGLDVIRDPTPDDADHCLIVPCEGGRFTDKIWSKLAKRTRVVYEHPHT